MESAKKMKWWKKWGYGVGDLGTNITYTMMSSFILIYCTNVLGLNAAVIGTMILVSRFFDGISDMIMGTIIDHTKSKAGKARFWILVAAIPVGLTNFMLFSIPGSFTENTKYVYFFIVYLLMTVVFYTMHNIAYSTFMALVTKNQEDQVSMYSLRMTFAMIGVLVMSFLTNAGVEAFGGGQKGWTSIAAIYGILGSLALITPALVLRELPEEQYTNIGEVKTKDEQRVGFWEAIKLLCTNKYFLIIFAIYLINYLVSGLFSSGMVYYATYILNNPNLMGLLSMTTTVPILIFISFVPKIVAKVNGMQKALLLGVGITIIGSVIVLAGGWMGFGVLMTGLIIKTLGSLPGSATFGPLTAASAENLYMRTGKRITGMFFSCTSIGTKIGSGLGTALYGVFLEMGGFNGLATVQSESATNTIRLLLVVPPLIGAVLNLLLFISFDVEKQNEKLLNER